MELAGRSTVRFFRKHPSFDVQAAAGDDAAVAGRHTLVERTPAVRGWIERRSQRSPGFARTLSFQYHYLTGIKAALRE